MNDLLKKPVVKYGLMIGAAVLVGFFIYKKMEASKKKKMLAKTTPKPAPPVTAPTKPV